MLGLSGCATAENPDKTWGLGKQRLTAVSAKAGAAKDAAPASPPASAQAGKGTANAAPQSLMPPPANQPAAANAAAVKPPVPAQPENLTDRALSLAAKARRAGDGLTASALYRQVLVERPKDFEAQLGLAHVLLDGEDLDTARPLCTELMQGFPQNDRVLGLMARLDIASGDLSTAAVRLALGASLAPESRDILQVQGMFEDMRGNHLAAQRVYNQILLSTPQDVAVRNNLALSLIAGNDPAAAAKILEAVIAEDALAPASVRHNLAMAYGLMDREQDARRLLAQDLPDNALESNLKFYRWLRLRRLPTTSVESARPVREPRSLPPVPVVSP